MIGQLAITMTGAHPEVAIGFVETAALPAPGITNSRRHDFVAPDTSYVGSAPGGGTTAESPTWTITRIIVAADGSTTTSVATNVAWIDRLTVTYS